MKRPNDNPLLEDARRSDLWTDATVRIQKKNAEKQIVYGVVYAPNEIDSQGEAMEAEDIEAMCHAFMRVYAQKRGEVIDTEHDNVVIGAFPVESYIETEDGKSWPKGSWIMGVKVDDPVIWSKIKKGLLNGFSFEAMVKKLNTVAEVDVETDYVGKTATNEDHDHIFFIEFNEEGRIISGCTSFDNGHRHEIVTGTTTELAATKQIAEHAHRLPL